VACRLETHRGPTPRADRLRARLRPGSWGRARPGSRGLRLSCTPSRGRDGDGRGRRADALPVGPGSWYRLGAQDPNRAPGFTIEHQTPATARVEGALHYWNVPSYALTYASGGLGWTSRLHLYASGGRQRYTWKTQHGYLASPADVRNQEFTVYVRLHQILDPPRVALTLKIRGGAHTARDGDRASCTMMTLEPGGSRAVTRFRKELVHPQYDSVTLTPAFATASSTTSGSGSSW